MAHFAEIDEHGEVVRVIRVHDSDCIDEDGQECEAAGAAFCSRLLGGTWVQTSYNNNIRRRFAGIGYRYDAALDAFIRPKPFASWAFDAESCDWLPPVPRPPGVSVAWSEEAGQWLPRD
jgi:hypothetical protein